MLLKENNQNMHVAVLNSESVAAIVSDNGSICSLLSCHSSNGH